MKQKSLNILLALSTLSWVSAMAQATTDDNIMPTAATDPATDSFDLYIRDNIEDTGLEPNTTTEIFWESPDIWYRNEKDGGTEHEMPYYDEDEHDAGHIYVKITNRGTKDFIWNNEKAQYVNLYYACVNIFPSVQTWMGLTTMSYKKYVDGGYIKSYRINKDIPTDSTTTLRIGFPLPSDICSDTTFKDLNFSYMALITDTPMKSYKDTTKFLFGHMNVIRYRKIAQKGVYKLRPKPYIPHTPTDDTTIVKISFSEEYLDSVKFYQLEFSDIYPLHNKTTLRTTPTVPFAIPNITVTQGNTVLKTEDQNSCKIDFSTMSAGDLMIQCKISNSDYLADYYKFSVKKEEGETGTILSGATFIIDMSEVKAQIAQRRAENAENKNTNTPRIESVYPSPAKDLITVKLSKPIEEEDAYIRAQAITDSRVWIDTPIRQEESQLQVDISTLPAGATSIQLILNKNMIDNNIILKK